MKYFKPSNEILLESKVHPILGNILKKGWTGDKSYQFSSRNTTQKGLTSRNVTQRESTLRNTTQKGLTSRNVIQKGSTSINITHM